MNCGVGAIDVSATIVDAERMQEMSPTPMSAPRSAAASASTDLAQARYVALTTFTRRNTPKLTPIWPIETVDGRIGFITSLQTWKVKRINENSRVVLQPSDAKGRPLADTVAVPGSAEVVVGEGFQAVRRKVKAKYGYQLRMIDLLHAIPGRRTGHRNDCAVIISFGDA